MKPLFMWAGGKNKMLKKYQPYLPEKFDKYVEPFFGGGAMFIWAYNKCPDAEFHINDINPHIMDIYRSVKNDVNSFMDKLDQLSDAYLPLEKLPPLKYKKDGKNIKEYRGRAKFYFDLRTEYAFDYQKWNKTEESAVLYFLMKTGFNGIWQINKNTGGRFGTPAGLLNQKDKVYDKQVVLGWNKMLQNTHIYNTDFENLKSRCDNGTFLFMDPPYRDSFTQYNTDFNDDEQRRVIKVLDHAKKNGAYVMLSNRDAGDNFFENECPNHSIVKFDVTYTAGRRKKTEDSFEAKKATEVLIF